MSNLNFISRRSVLAGLIASAAVVSVKATGHELPSERLIPLKDAAASKGLIFGASVRSQLLGEPEYDALLIRDAGLVVPGNALKWGPLEQQRNVYRFDGADQIADFAAKHDMAMRGHTLLWHKQTPKWLPDALNTGRRDAEKLIINHINAVAGRYRGRMHSWDVVNEAIQPKDGRGDGLRRTVFLDALGPEYIDLAFHAAHQADPKACLILNDYNLEAKWRSSQRRRRSMLLLLERLLANDVPVHAIGIQGHLDPGRKGAFDALELDRFCDEVEKLGLEIHITELDARDNLLTGNALKRDIGVADAYKRFLDVVLACNATKSVTTWGITDRHSWLSRHFPRSDDTLTRGLPYDAEYQHKRAWHALSQAFDTAPMR